MCELCWMSAAKSGKKIINWWDIFASATFAFDHRVWGSVGCGVADGETGYS